MAKDYAKRVGRLTGSSKKGIWIKSCIVTVILLFIAGLGIYLYKAPCVVNSDSFTIYFKRFFTHSNNVLQSPANSTDRESDVHFDFYTTLPTMQVAVDDEVNQTTDKNTSESSLIVQPLPAKPITSVNGYVVQLGRFKDSVEANQFRLSLLLSGFDSEIFEIHESSGNIYRVQRGPFANATEAKRLQQKLKNKGIESEIIK